MLDGFVYSLVAMLLMIATALFHRAYDGSRDLEWNYHYRTAMFILYLATAFSVVSAMFSIIDHAS